MLRHSDIGNPVVIDMKNVGIRYDLGPEVLSDINLSLRKGSFHFLTGKSGAGKSTHSQLWLDNIPNTELINDDNPIVRIYENGNVRVYGSPWSGKTPCYKQACVPVNAAVSLHKAGSNKILQLQPVSAFIEILSSVSSLMCYRPCYDGILRTVIKFTESVPVYSLECLPDGSAAELCYETVCRQK